MKKYRPPAPVTVTIFAILALAAYGLRSWYFPARETWFLVAPLSVAGVALALWLYPRMEHLYATRARKIIARVGALLLIPFLLCAAFGLGAPAISLRVQGANTQIAATVTDKTERFKRCRNKVELAEYSQRLCVSGREFERLQEGQRVLLDARVGMFGTLVFSLQPG